MSRIVQITTLGNFGRLGNQMFQYAFARAYAEKFNAILETPNWIGEKIFKQVSHRPISRHLPRCPINTIPWGDVNIDLYGYFQYKECFDILSEAKLREWFTFQDRWVKLYNTEDEIVAHIRRGDYAANYSGTFCIVSKESYLRACRQFGFDEQKLVWLSEENPTVDNAVDSVSYKKMGNSMYGSGMYEDKGISFLPDFFRMINAKVLLRANSTFSFWAGFFRGDKETYSPVVKNKIGCSDVDFAKGNWPALVPAHDNIVFEE